MQKSKSIYLSVYFIATIISLWFTIGCAFGQAQNEDAIIIKSIYDDVLLNGKSYEWLDQLCRKAPARLCGSENYNKAVALTSKQLSTIKGIKVYTQSSSTKVWKRGKKEKAEITNTNGKKFKLNVLSLGNSIGTGKKISGEVIEVKSLDEVDERGDAGINGKIVFYNRPMDAAKINTFHAYGGAVDQRVHGASRAAKYGAIGVLVRSMTTRADDYPHTGTLQYKEDLPKIAALAVSTNDANKLSEVLKEGITTCTMVSDAQILGISEVETVIGEIKGTEFPDEVIVVGGHLDSWDVGQGAHDDGSGCVQSMDVLRTLLAIDYKPKRTIRCVLFANEENGLSGGIAYAKAAMEKKEFHLAAIESDAGGFTPKGFSFDADTSVLKRYYKNVYDNFLPLFESYGITFSLGGSGADIGPLKPLKGLLVGLRPDSQRYFDFHHTVIDTFEAVNERELKLGSASMTALVYLLDKYGLQ